MSLEEELGYYFLFSICFYISILAVYNYLRHYLNFVGSIHKTFKKEEEKWQSIDLNLSFDIDINADEEEKISEEEMVKILQKLYYNDKIELLSTLRYYFEVEKRAYHVIIEPQKVYFDD